MSIVVRLLAAVCFLLVSSGASQALDEKCYLVWNPAAFARAVNRYVDLGEAATIKELSKAIARRAKLNARNPPKCEPPLSTSTDLSAFCIVLWQPMKSRWPRIQGIGGLIELPLGRFKAEDFPDYPLVKSGNTYFQFRSSIFSSGAPPETDDEYFPRCREHAAFRSQHIIVPTRAEALADVVQLRQSPEWTRLWANKPRYVPSEAIQYKLIEEEAKVTR